MGLQVHYNFYFTFFNLKIFFPLVGEDKSKIEIEQFIAALFCSFMCLLFERERACKHVQAEGGGAEEEGKRDSQVDSTLNMEPDAGSIS